MKKALTVLVLIGSLLFQLPAVAANDAGAESSAPAGQQEQEKGADKEDNGMLIFWLVFAGAVLFVLSSATALNSLGGKPPPRSHGDGTGPQRKKKTAEGKERFRL